MSFRKLMRLFTALSSSLILFLSMNSCVQSQRTSGNPIFPGWYSDPEAVIWEGEYWVFPTASLPFEEQTYMDAFSSKDLVNWTKHEHIVDTTEVKWIWQAMWSPAVITPPARSPRSLPVRCCPSSKCGNQNPFQQMTDAFIGVRHSFCLIFRPLSDILCGKRK